MEHGSSRKEKRKKFKLFKFILKMFFLFPLTEIKYKRIRVMFR